MSCQAQPTSPTRSVFRRHRHRASSSDSSYSCDSTPHYQLSRARSPPRSAFQTPPSSFPYQVPCFAPTAPSFVLSCESLGGSQSSVDHGSSSYHSAADTRYPEPYTSDPFLPLRALRHLRSNELLLISPSVQPLVAPPTPTRGARKPPPTLAEDIHPNSSAAEQPPQGPFPEVEQALHSPSQSRAMRHIIETLPEVSEPCSDSEVGTAYTCNTSPPIDLYPASPRESLESQRSLAPEQPRARATWGRTSTIAERRATNASDLGSALHFVFGLQVNDIEGHRVNVCDSLVENVAIDTEEQNALVDVYGGMEQAGSVGQAEACTAASPIRIDPDKTPTNELEKLAWPDVSTASFHSSRKRPPPIYIGTQAQRSARTEMIAADEEIPVLKTAGQRDSPADITLCQNNASQFSLSMFPPTPTTPLHGDIVWAGLSSGTSPGGAKLDPPLLQAFSPTRHCLSAPFAPATTSLTSLTSRPLPSPPAHYRSAPTTPASSPTVEELLHIRRRANLPSGRSSTESQPIVPSQPYQHPLAYRASAERRQDQYRKRSDTTSSGSDSVYSQSSSSCYSDDGASMSSSMCAAVLQAQEERRRSRQARLEYMRRSAMSDPSLASNDSLSMSDSPVESTGAITPSEDHLDEKPAVPFPNVVRRGAVPTINVMPPSRKPVPRADTISIVSEPFVPEPRKSLPESKQPKPSPSLRSLRARSEHGACKTRTTGKIVISHPHLNNEDGPGAQVLPKGTSIGASHTTLLPPGEARRLSHSKSMSSLMTAGASGSAPVEKKKTKKKKEPKPLFDRHGLPSEEQLKLASEMNVFDERGLPVRFGDVFQGQKTAVCFIRHFWCPLCQDYMSSIVHLTEPSFVERAGVKLVIIGNGSPAMIKAYKNDIFHCPYEMYTDPSRKVYNALGMTLRTTEGGDEDEKGSYVKHGTFTGTMMVLKNALKMPLANAGDIKQLGGEFILGPGLSCSFTSRMHTTRSHTPIRDLLQAAGVDTNPWSTDLSLLQSGAEQTRWMDVQNEDLDRIIRRGLRASCGDQYCGIDEGEDAMGAGELDLGEFRRLLERLKSEVPEPVAPAVDCGPSYEIEVMGQARVELDRLGAVLQSRNGSGTWEACRTRVQSTSRPSTGRSLAGRPSVS